MSPFVKRIDAVLLMPENLGQRVQSIALMQGVKLVVTTVQSFQMLERAIEQPCELLLSFGMGIIVPKYVLDKPGLRSVNVHAASPDFPGRDPHHFAVYAGVKTYGATLHYMSEVVDDGPIIDSELVDVPDGASPIHLLELASEAGFMLVDRFFEQIASSSFPAPNSQLKWGANKTTRQDFSRLCQIDCKMSRIEFFKRMNATSMPGYENLFIDIHGFRFKLIGKAD